MIIEIALVVIALALCFICVSLMRAQTERRIKAERQLQAHQAKEVHWEKVVNIREDRMKAWDSTDAGQRLAVDQPVHGRGEEVVVLRALLFGVEEIGVGDDHHPRGASEEPPARQAHRR